MSVGFNPAVHSSTAIVWQIETVYGPIIRRKEVEVRPAYNDSFTYYWLEAPQDFSFLYQIRGKYQDVRDMSLNPFRCHNIWPVHQHLRIYQSFPYNIAAICGDVRVRVYEPWYHFEQIEQLCQQVLSQLRLRRKAATQRPHTTQRAKCVLAMVLALVAERQLDLDASQVQKLYERVFTQDEEP